VRSSGHLLEEREGAGYRRRYGLEQGRSLLGFRVVALTGRFCTREPKEARERWVMKYWISLVTTMEAAGSRIPVILPQTRGRWLPQVDGFPVQWMDFARQKERSRR